MKILFAAALLVGGLIVGCSNPCVPPKNQCTGQNTPAGCVVWGGC